MALTVAWLAGAASVGYKVWTLTGKVWLGWAVGIATAFLLGLLLFPSINALDELTCEGADDFEACMEAGADDPDFR